MDLLASTRRKAKTHLVNTTLEDLVTAHSPHLVQNQTKRINFYYATQIETSPPRTVIMSNVSKDIKEAYKRYLVKGLKKRLGFQGIPIELIFRDKQEQLARKERMEMLDQSSEQG